MLKGRKWCTVDYREETWREEVERSGETGDCGSNVFYKILVNKINNKMDDCIFTIKLFKNIFVLC